MDAIQGVAAAVHGTYGGFAFSADGRYLAVANTDVTIYKFGDSCAKPLHTLRRYQFQKPNGLCFGNVNGHPTLFVLYKKPRHMKQVTFTDSSIRVDIVDIHGFAADFDDDRQLLVVSNPTARVVNVFGFSGSTILASCVMTIGAGDLQLPYHLKLRGDEVFVTDLFKSSVKSFSVSTGETLLCSRFISSICDFAEDDEGFLFVRSYLGHGIFRESNAVIKGTETKQFTWVSYIPALRRCVAKATTGEIFILRRKWLDTTSCAFVETCCV